MRILILCPPSRLVQLGQVRRIADALGIGDSLGDVDYTCETAAHFYRHPQAPAATIEPTGRLADRLAGQLTH